MYADQRLLQVFAHGFTVDVAIVAGIVNHHVRAHGIGEQAVVEVAEGNVRSVVDAVFQGGRETVAHPDAQVFVVNVGLVSNQ